MRKGPLMLRFSALVLVFSIFCTPIIIPHTANAQTLSAEERAKLQQELAQLEAEVAQKQKELANQQGVSGTLSGDIKVLNARINQKKAEINAKGAKINQLSQSISEKQATIRDLNQQLEVEKESLAQLLRKTEIQDRVSLSSFLLSSKDMGDFYADVSNYNALREKIQESVTTIKRIQGVTEETKKQLEVEQDKTIDEKDALEQARISIQQSQTQQQRLLAISKDKEKAYKAEIAAQQAKVGQIKAKLFTLAGGASAIRFDVALQYANAAAAQTGIDPAFLLAELTQESSLGKNVGQCYLSDTTTGASVGVNSGKVFSNGMKPSRDVAPFLDITSKLGLDWKTTRISCPVAGVAGYGGAMGPAQFIPSTWKLFENRLRSALGREPNPWVAQDAFMAAAFYLTDLGGVGNSAAAQLRAACKYYGTGGSTCSYGRSVQTLKQQIQADIDYLNQYGVSRR